MRDPEDQKPDPPKCPQCGAPLPALEVTVFIGPPITEPLYGLTCPACTEADEKTN